jgi:hypothetical protein
MFGLLHRSALRSARGDTRADLERHVRTQQRPYHSDKGMSFVQCFYTRVFCLQSVYVFSRILARFSWIRSVLHQRGHWLAGWPHGWVAFGLIKSWWLCTLSCPMNQSINLQSICHVTSQILLIPYQQNVSNQCLGWLKYSRIEIGLKFWNHVTLSMQWSSSCWGNLEFDVQVSVRLNPFSW